LQAALAKLVLGPRAGKEAHITQIPLRESLFVRELVAQIARESVDELAVPAMFLHPHENLVADTPIKRHELRSGCLP